MEASLVEEKVAVLDFAWLELTNQCNLHCIHCYSESSPYSDDKDILGEGDYLRLLAEIRGIGCKEIQFIGGEPTLNKSLPLLIREAHILGFELIEVFTNLYHLPESLLQTFIQYNAAIATSFYSVNPNTYDTITKHKGSFRKTVQNIGRILDAGLSLRVAVIQMEENRDDLSETWTFLESIGVKSIGTDHVRGIGRGENDHACGMGELCGNCAGNILSVGPDGLVAPCIMSKQWAAGSVLEQDLGVIAASKKLKDIRTQIGIEVNRRVDNWNCQPTQCAPYSCAPNKQPCTPCPPSLCSPCSPK